MFTDLESTLRMAQFGTKRCVLQLLHLSHVRGAGDNSDRGRRQQPRLVGVVFHQGRFQEYRAKRSVLSSTPSPKKCRSAS
ncbi:hypothetical protein LR48_Vigan845s002900 [Vigna angularis]|uniref:Uncharacterized protein n=1 Tax=Phaseolus angularis TaxID=3914 RepID=A0A0L9THR5_PHAAN|nr:hypothetical protein LR48_Vigan845s002900 [Vigna angularis]